MALKKQQILQQEQGDADNESVDIKTLIFRQAKPLKAFLRIQLIVHQIESAYFYFISQVLTSLLIKS